MANAKDPYSEKILPPVVGAVVGGLAGALRAGCAAAFVARPDMVLDPLVEPPDIVGADLRKVVTQIIARDA